jgi:thymidylate synthase
MQLTIPKVEDIREHFKLLLRRGEYVIDKTGCKTLEIVNAHFKADQDSIFGKPNEYIERELEWYRSQSLSVDDIPGVTPKIWTDIASEYGEINSNYGWCVYSRENGAQLKNVIEELQNNPDSRRAIMIYNRPSMWKDYNRNGMNDFMCTNAVQYRIIGNYVHAHVQMRSNDAVYGYKNDWAWQSYILGEVANLLNTFPGTITWTASSLHVYERHFGLLK